jgi:phosphoenolpyruvate phosphomutase
MSLKKTTQLRRLIAGPDLGFCMEAHNGLSAKIVEEAGFPAIWGSGLSISAALGVRDNNEATWTQVLEVVEFMSDATAIPILLDGDTGYGNFNTMRRLVRKLEQRGVAGVCIEDKQFPKTNSFIRGAAQPLADMKEFVGKIKAGKDAQTDPDFVIVARVEALIAGWGMPEALRRAEAYRLAGADAILIHSALSNASEVLAFKREWGDRSPVVIVPTKYYMTPTVVFREAGFSLVLWANHVMRAAVTAMRATARQIKADEHLLNVEDRIVSVADVFRLQGDDELEQAEQRYLPKNADAATAIVLGAGRGKELGELTESRPKCMVNVAGRPILAHIADTYRAVGVKDIRVVRGYRKDQVDIASLQYYDNDLHETTLEAFSLYKAVTALSGHCVVCYGDVLFKKYILQELLELDAEFAIAVDADWRVSRNRGRAADYVVCSQPNSRLTFQQPVRLVSYAPDDEAPGIHGESMGLLKMSPAGAEKLAALLNELAQQPMQLATLNMPDLIAMLIARGEQIAVIYTAGHWIDIDMIDDVLVAGSFVGPTAGPAASGTPASSARKAAQ